jgi:hypothetical protein
MALSYLENLVLAKLAAHSKPFAGGKAVSTQRRSAA